MVNNMQAGSIIYDLAAIQGGNTAFTEVDTIVEKMDSLGWSDRNITIEFNKRKLQAFDVGAGAAKLQYVLKVGKMDIIKFEIRYKGNFTSQPQFLGVFTNKFKALLK